MYMFMSMCTCICMQMETHILLLPSPLILPWVLTEVAQNGGLCLGCFTVLSLVVKPRESLRASMHYVKLC